MKVQNGEAKEKEALQEEGREGGRNQTQTQPNWAKSRPQAQRRPGSPPASHAVLPTRASPNSHRSIPAPGSRRELPGQCSESLPAAGTTARAPPDTRGIWSPSRSRFPPAHPTWLEPFPRQTRPVTAPAPEHASLSCSVTKLSLEDKVNDGFTSELSDGWGDDGVVVGGGGG